jgi:hypothetical protein
MRLQGIKGYDCCKSVNLETLLNAREWEYPDFLSAMYFKDIAAFENYAKSPERLAFQRAVANIFPNGLNYRWYVQYQLVQSRRK